MADEPVMPVGDVPPTTPTAVSTNIPVTVTATNVEPSPPDSSIYDVSVRAWLVVMIVATVCGMCAFGREVGEPLYTLVLISTSFYFGQKVASARS